jgi:hypothetical protein
MKERSVTFNAADLAILKGSALAANDVFNMLYIPYGAHVLTVTWQVMTQEGNTFTFALGDSTAPALVYTNGILQPLVQPIVLTSVSATSYLTSADANTAAAGSSFNAASSPAANGVGKFYQNGGSIDLKILTGVPANAIIKLGACYAQTFVSSIT